MRAVLVQQLKTEDIQVGDLVKVEGDQARHLIKVIRVRLDEEILLLNGQGIKFYGQVSSVDKKSVGVLIQRVESTGRKMHMDLLLGLPKKDALELIVRQACELGLGKIFTYFAKYSQYELEKPERLNRIIESGVIQSNNPFLLEVNNVKSLEDIIPITKAYDLVVYLSMEQGELSSLEKIDAHSKILLVVGPEGGFDRDEDIFFKQLENVIPVNLPTYILRSPTAVVSSFGLIASRMR